MAPQQDQSIPAARRVRFHQPRTNPAGPPRASIRFDVGGKPAGQLKEFPTTGGSRWAVSSIDVELSAIAVGRDEALPLGRICRLVEQAAAGAGGDEPLAREEERRRQAEEPAPASPVRFRPPVAGSAGWADIGVEVDGRLVGHLREAPAERQSAGSEWFATSRVNAIDRIGRAAPLALGEACRQVEAAAELARDKPPAASMAERARAATARSPDPGRCR